MIPPERRWRGSLRLIKSRLSRFVIPGPPSAVRNLLLTHCRFLVATFLGMTKRIDLDCDFRRLTFVIPNRFTGCGKSLNRDDSPPQGLKPSLVLHDLRGAKAPLYHSAAGFRDFLRSLFSREESAGRFTSPPTDPPNHLRSCTTAGNSSSLAPSH